MLSYQSTGCATIDRVVINKCVCREIFLQMSSITPEALASCLDEM